MSGVALEFLPPVTAARLFNKDKCLEPMFGDVGHARTNAAMLLMLIATTSSHTCSKPTVGRRQSLFRGLQLVFIQVFFEFCKSHFFSFLCNLFFDFSKHFYCVKSFFFFICRLHYIQFLWVNECQVAYNHNVNLLNCNHEF